MSLVLNKQQVTAIASKIHKELNDAHKAEVKKFEDNFKLPKEYNKIAKLYTEIEALDKKREELKESLEVEIKSKNLDLGYYNPKDLETFTEKISDIELEKKVVRKNISIQDITNEIYLLTIDTDNLEELLTKLNNKLK